MNLCQRCKKECKHDLEKCTYYSPAKMTNFEKIKAMSIEELARLLGCIFVDCDEFTRTIDGKIIFDSFNSIEEWLESEAEDTLSEAINKCNEQLEKHPKFDFSGVKIIKE